MQVMIFLKTSELDTLECLSLTPKKKIFLNVKQSLKKMSESTKLHGVVWVYDRGAACHVAHDECHLALLGCRSALWKCQLAFLECQMALGHAMMLTQWWANSVCFSNVCFVFSRFLKKFTSFVIMKHSPSQLQTLWNLFQTWLGIDAAYINEFSCDKSLHKG